MSCPRGPHDDVMGTPWVFERSKGDELRCLAEEDADHESLAILWVVELLRRTPASGDASHELLPTGRKPLPARLAAGVGVWCRLGMMCRVTVAHPVKFGGQLPGQATARNGQGAGGRLQIVAQVCNVEFDSGCHAASTVEDRHRDS